MPLQSMQRAGWKPALRLQRRNTMTFLLIHSPFLGPLSWRPLHSALNERGEADLLLDLRAALTAEGDYYAAFGAAAARQIDGPPILVAHSGAGPFLPAILNAGGNAVKGAVFVDALLPHPGKSWFDTAPVALASRLRAKADDNLAPPWTSWWPPEVLARLLPDPSMRASLTQEAPRAPLAFLDEPAPMLPDPLATPCAYLQLSAGYDAEAARARALGWPVERFDGHHLSIMTDSDRVAAAIVALARRLAQ